LQTIKVKLD